MKSPTLLRVLVCVLGLLLCLFSIGVCLLGIKFPLELMAMAVGVSVHHTVINAVASCFGTLGLWWGYRDAKRLLQHNMTP